MSMSMSMSIRDGMSSGGNKAAQSAGASKSQQQATPGLGISASSPPQLQPAPAHNAQVLALLLIQDTPQTRATFRHTLQWLIHPLLKYISAAVPSALPNLLVGIIVYSADHLHTIPFQPALEFLKTCAANARFPFAANPPLSHQQEEDDELFDRLVSSQLTPPATPPGQEGAEAEASGAAPPVGPSAQPRSHRPGTTTQPINLANVLAAVLQMFQERCNNPLGLDPTNPLPAQFPPTHSRHVLQFCSATTPLAFECQPTRNLNSSYDSMSSLALAHELSKLRSLSSSSSLDEPSADLGTPEMAITSVVLRSTSHGRPSASESSPSSKSTLSDSERLHWLLALSIASQDPIQHLEDVSELGPSVPDILDNPRDILKAEEYESLVAFFQPSNAPNGSASSPNAPLVMFSNFIASVRPSTQAVAGAGRMAGNLVNRKRSLEALRAGVSAGPSGFAAADQMGDAAPNAKRARHDKGDTVTASAPAANADAHAKQPGHTRSGSDVRVAPPHGANNGAKSSTNAGTSASASQAQLLNNFAKLNLPSTVSNAERNKILFLIQQHSLMLRNLGAIQARMQQEQQDAASGADEEKRKAGMAHAKVQFQNMEQLRAKIVTEQKALQDSVVAMATPPVNKSASLDQGVATSSSAVNINDNLRRTLDIDTQAKTLGLDLGGLKEQLQAQMFANSKQQHAAQQMAMQQRQQREGQDQVKLQRQGSTGSAGGADTGASAQQASAAPGGPVAIPRSIPPPTQPQNTRPHVFWTGSIMVPGVGGGSGNGQQMATVVTAACPLFNNEAELMLPWPKSLQLSGLVPISSIRDMQALATSKTGSVQCAIFNTLPPNPAAPGTGLAAAQAAAGMQAHNEKVYGQLSKMLQDTKIAAFVNLPNAPPASDDPTKIGPGLLIVGFQAAHNQTVMRPKLLGLILKEPVSRLLISGPPGASGGRASSVGSLSSDATQGQGQAPSIRPVPKPSAGVGLPASSYIGSGFGAAPTASAPLVGASGPAGQPGGQPHMTAPAVAAALGGAGGGVPPIPGGVPPPGMPMSYNSMTAAAASAIAAAAGRPVIPQQPQPQPQQPVPPPAGVGPGPQMPYLPQQQQGQQSNFNPMAALGTQPGMSMGAGVNPGMGPGAAGIVMGAPGTSGPGIGGPPGPGFIMPFGFNPLAGGTGGGAGNVPGTGPGAFPPSMMPAPFAGGTGAPGMPQQQQQQQQAQAFMGGAGPVDYAQLARMMNLAS